jgi:uroporphyrinogen-III synthase
MQTPRILITRPEPGASRTAARLRAAGFEAVVLPLTRIERLAFGVPEGRFDGVVVTSAQALAGVDASRFISLPVVAVGDTTATAAREMGFSRIETASGSVESVAAVAAANFERGNRFY